MCGNCGAGNDPSRKFCRRCGTGLEAAPIVKRLPWWRRLFGGGQKPKAAVPAGERPANMRKDASAAKGGGKGSAVKNVISLALVALIAAGVTGYVVVPGVHDAVNGAVNQIRMTVAPTYVPVNTAGQASGAGISGHPAQAAFDGFNNTFWAAPAGASQPAIVAHFAPAADLAKVLITSGDATDYQAQPRPRTIRIAFLDASGATVFTKDYDLQDVKDPQTLDVAATGAASVRITVLSVYQSIKGTSVSITEVEFRARQ